MTTTQGYVFESAEEAVKWAVEVLRRRRLPQTAGFWREIAAEADWVEATWQGSKNVNLPKDADERLSVALKVFNALDVLAQREVGLAQVLTLWAMGDWADEGRLRAALAIQEKCRREGMRVRIAYRYSYSQLGDILGCDKKVAWRRVQEGLGLLGEILAGMGLVGVIQAPVAGEGYFKKHVYFNEFKS